jgi:hypothetical protein
MHAAAVLSWGGFTPNSSRSSHTGIPDRGHKLGVSDEEEFWLAIRLLIVQ